MNSLQLHRRLVQQLTAIGVPASRPQRNNLALLCQSLAMSPNCHLETLALSLPLPGKRSSLARRLRRLLKNEQVQPATWYEPVARHLFAHWSGREVSLVMDRTDLGDRWSILMVGAAYRKRVLPLAWEVLPFGGTSAERQTALLERVQPCLPPLEQVRVHYYGDSEFRSVTVHQTVKGYGWHWHIGLKSDELFHTGDGHWRPLGEVVPPPGERHYLQGVTLTRQHAFGPVNVIAYWLAEEAHPRYWSLDQPANKRSWRRGRKRFWIEPTFRDWKSYGFDLERSHINDPERLDVLLLAISVTTVWLIYIGDWLTQHGRRHWLEPRHKHDYSLFRLGRDHLQRARTVGCHVPVGLTVSRAG